MPFYFGFIKKLPMRICKAQRFFEVFFLSYIPEFVPMQPEMYKVLARIDIFKDHKCDRHRPDLKWLLELSLQHPKIRLQIDVWNCFNGGRTYFQRLQDIVRSNKAWLKRIQDFEGIEMWLDNCDAEHFLADRIWHLDLVLKPEVAEPWWDDKEERSKQTQELLTELGLREMNPPGALDQYCQSLVVNVGNGAYCRHSDYYDHDRHQQHHYLRKHGWDPLERR